MNCLLEDWRDDDLLRPNNQQNSTLRTDDLQDASGKSIQLPRSRQFVILRHIQ
jgi:hypothetical protein